MKSFGTSFGRGIAAMAMLLGAPGLFSGQALDLGPTKQRPERKMVRDYSGWGRSSARYSTPGDKERRRHAGRPNGLMHTPTPNLRSNDFKRALAAQQAAAPEVAAKPARKPRAKKAAAAA